MKKIFFCLVLLLALQQVVPAQAHHSLPKLIQQYFTLCNLHDSVAAAAMFATNAELYSPNWSGTEKGQTGAKNVLHRYFESTPNLQYHITHTVYSKNEAVVEYMATGTLQHGEAGTPAYMIGKDYTLQQITRFTFLDNHITSAYSYFDQVSFLKQVGFFDQH
ncbi:nuclear transport factor 2 family protein [Hydrotalea sp.]|uniref:nuclear transport factor 2 family protein n=1 Tax=Hydrotalea sp. TaxID=2881279 RepID=UPI0026175CBA|nr:nuclear transport factor 2 family protein [Hydrotalea sp.]